MAWLLNEFCVMAVFSNRQILIVLGLLSPSLHASHSMHGALRLKGDWILNQEAQNGSQVSGADSLNDSFDLSRARLDFSGDIVSGWQYSLRFEINEYENSQIPMEEQYPTLHFFHTSTNWYLYDFPGNLYDTVSGVIAQAYVSYTTESGVRFAVGHAPAPEITLQRLSYQPYIGLTPPSRSSRVDCSLCREPPGARSFRHQRWPGLQFWSVAANHRSQNCS